MATLSIVSSVSIDDEPGDVPPHRPLPSPDDRLWRHPSEIGASITPRVAPPQPGSSRRTRHVALGVLSGLLGAAAMFAILSASGAFGEHRTSVVVEKVSAPLSADPTNVQTVAQRVLPGLARLDATTTSGTASSTAVVFRSDGYLVTTADAVGHGARLSVQLSDGTTLPAKLLGVDPISDVAVVKVGRTHLTPAVLADEDDIALGEPAIAISCVAGRPKQPDVDAGVVSALGRRTNASSGQSLLDMIQTNVPRTAVGAAAVLVDVRGSVMGLITSNQSDLGASASKGVTTTVAEFVARFATPIDYARQVADELIATGRVDHAWLGVETSDLDGAAEAAIGQPGAQIIDVVASSPAAQAGLRAGDVVVAIDGSRVTSSANLAVRLRRDRPQQVVDITYLRDGSEHHARATLVDRTGR
jgi:S1-C subfamily serine protease